MVEAPLQQYSVDEVALHNTDKSAWIIMEGKIYDVTKFLMEHPGGEEVILEYAGKDATSGFNDVGHSSDAKQLANDYLIGTLDGSTAAPKNDAKASENAEKSSANDTWSDIIFSPTWTNFLIPVAISISVYVIYKLAQRVVDNLYV